MNSRLFFTIVSLAGLTFSGCKKSETETPATPARTQVARPVEAPTPAPPPVAAGPTESERMLAQQLREAKTRQLELELKLEEEKLARTDAEIAEEQSLLNKERDALWQAQEPYIANISTGSAAPLPVSLNNDRGYGCDYQMFYDDLTPYGAWYDSADYGNVWCPAICVTDRSWRPYTLGSWASCDQGWAWCSDEPFGWACYHYGRWAQLRGRGWVWVPGDQWAPCWVSWRRNDDYIGWCPLPPETVYNRDCTYGSTIDRDCGINPGCYVFMPVKHFDRPCRNYCEAPVTCIKICASTVNITNIVVRPGRVECHGPGVDWIQDRVRRPVPRYALALESGKADSKQRAHRLEKDKIRYYAPKVQAPWNPQLRPARRATLESQEFVRADGGLPDKLASRFKTEREERERATGSLKGGAKAVVERQQRLTSLVEARESLREQVARQKSEARAASPDSSTARVEHLDRGEKPVSRNASARAVTVPESPQSTATVAPVATGTETAPAVKTREDLNSRREQLVRQREDQTAAAELQRKEDDAASRREVVRNDRDQQDKQSALRAQITERQAAMELQRRAAEAASRADSAAARETEKQTALRAQIEEKRRQQQEAQIEKASARAAVEQQRRPSDAGVRAETARNEGVNREADRQSAIRAAQEQQSRQAAEEAKAGQQARQRESMEQQRAANDQQRRQADAEARAEQQRREAAESQRRQEQADARQRQVQEEQRRNAEQQQQQRQEAETRQQRVQEEQRRGAEEQQRRQSEEHAKNAEQQRRQDDDRNREDKGGRR